MHVPLEAIDAPSAHTARSRPARTRLARAPQEPPGVGAPEPAARNRGVWAGLSGPLTSATAPFAARSAPVRRTLRPRSLLASGPLLTAC